MVYADESFYHENYLLGRKPAISAGFPFYARQASQVVDQYTFGRLQELEDAEIPDVVRMCCCELAEAGFRQERQQEESGGKTSERIGTYSVSYGSVQEASNAAAKEQRSIVMKWLAGTGLCYQGVR